VYVTVIEVAVLVVLKVGAEGGSALEKPNALLLAPVKMLSNAITQTLF
jgi:hypothetical protein